MDWHIDLKESYDSQPKLPFYSCITSDIRVITLAGEGIFLSQDELEKFLSGKRFFEIYSWPHDLSRHLSPLSSFIVVLF